jgi:hypothetical protein
MIVLTSTVIVKQTSLTADILKMAPKDKKKTRPCKYLSPNTRIKVIHM